MATLVQIKRSTANTLPGSLQAGELAYSYASNVVFIGDTAGGVMNIGGKFYTDLVDNATAANGASNFVRRYANGSAQFSQLDILLSPTSDSHVATKAYVDNAVSGNVTLASLNDVNIGTAFSDQNNKILIGNSAGYYVGTSVSGNVTVSNTGVFVIGNQQVVGSMLADTLAGNKTFSDTITIGKDLTVSGNLNVLGNTVTVNVETLSVEDSLIKLASNNTTDAVDIGFFGVYNSNTYAGLYRDASDNKFKLFTDYTGADPTGNVIGTTARATLEANLDAITVLTQSANVVGTLNVGTAAVSQNLTVSQNANITGTLNVTSAVWLSSLTLGSALPTGSGGTGLSSFTANGVFFADTSSSVNFATGTEGQVLQIASGVPAFAMLDGGSF